MWLSSTFAASAGIEPTSAMVGVAAQKDHAARHHLLGIDVRDLKAEHLGVEPRRPLHVAHIQNDMSQLADAERKAVRALQAPHAIRIVHVPLPPQPTYRSGD